MFCNRKFVLSHSFLNFLRSFCKLKEQFRVWENFSSPREFDHHFLPQGQGIRQKSYPGGRDSLAQKNFPGGCRGGGGGCTQLELTETLLALYFRIALPIHNA